jgi:tetraacyldisaccharide 4'-kinase
VGPTPRQRADEVGDEPVEMARRLPGVPVVVSADRVLGGREAVRLGADVVVLDDGFQHLRLERDLDILLLDAGDPWGGGRLPPMGRLREPVSGLGRADAVVITKVPLDWRPATRAVEAAVREIAPQVPVFVARVRPSRLRRPDGSWASCEELAGRRVFAFAGVARPGGFRDSLEEAGAEVVGERWFRDHHEYTKDELAQVMASSEELKAIPVTTAKDAVKLSDDAGAWVLESEMVPVAGGWRELWELLPEVAG